MSSSEVAAVGVRLRLEAVEIGLESQMVQEVGDLRISASVSEISNVKTYRLREPTTASRFEPTQVSAET